MGCVCLRSKIYLGFPWICQRATKAFVVIVTYSMSNRFNAVETQFRLLLLSDIFCCSNWEVADWRQPILRNFHRIMQYSGANVDYTQNALPLNSVAALFLPYQISFFTAFMVCICLPQSLSPPHWKTCLTPLNRSPGSRVLWCCKGRVRISIFPSMVQYMHHITHHRHRKRFADLNLKTNLIHTIFMRSDFMPGRFVCTTDDNTAVIMQVQFPREYNPRVLRYMHVSIHMT